MCVRLAAAVTILLPLAGAQAPDRNAAERLQQVRARLRTARPVPA